MSVLNGEMPVVDENGLGRIWGRMKTYIDKILQGGVYPVGSIYLSVNDVNPSEYFGGTWIAWGTGRVPVGVDASQAEFNAAEKTGGEKTHILSVNEIPAHEHQQRKQMNNGGVGGKVITNQSGGCNGDGPEAQVGWYTGKAPLNTTSTGGGQAHNNLQPYVTCYMWKRTA